MPIHDISLTVKQEDSTIREGELIRKFVDEAIARGDIHMELKAGSDDWIVRPASFTIDKRKYSIRFTDETEESVKVWIEPVA